LLVLPSSLGEVERREASERGPWLRLLPDVRSARWRFFQPVLQEWADQWPEGGERPPLVELTLVLLGEEIPRSYVFWLPPVKEDASGGSPEGAWPEEEPAPEP
jgi:hypothetical protein